MVAHDRWEGVDMGKEASYTVVTKRKIQARIQPFFKREKLGRENKYTRYLNLTLVSLT